MHRSSTIYMKKYTNFNVRRQQVMDFLTAGIVIMDYGLVFLARSNDLS